MIARRPWRRERTAASPGSGVEREGAQTIGLCMIVRNEAQILERCLQSVAGMIDSWVICDTGSSDGTPELVDSLLGHLPGQLHLRPWVDFGHNRSELLALAKGAADYLLLIDADMTLRHDGRRSRLDADAYLLRETGGLDFGVIRLVRGDRLWWYEGSTHEYIATDGTLDRGELDEWRIEHHGDGAARPQKLLRDAGLLKRDILSEPENPRSIFYLAQTYRDLDKHDLAASYYRRRVSMGGWEEEVFYANLQEGVLRIKQDLAAGAAILLEAWQRRPSRAEPLFELAQAYRQHGAFELARMFAERGLEVPYPADVLFIHKWVYDYGLLMERAFACGGLGDLEQARADLAKTLEIEQLPAEVRDYIERSLEEIGQQPTDFSSGAPHSGQLHCDHLYSAQLHPDQSMLAYGTPVRERITHSGPPRLARIAPSVRIGAIKLDVKPAWPSFNPSIASDGDGFRMIVRTANYEIERGVLHADGVLHNINYLVALSADLGVTQIEPIVDRSHRQQIHETKIVGYEDCRLVQVNGRWYASATVCDTNQVDRREIALLTLDGADIVNVQPLAGPNPARHEKNWMPFTIDEDLHFLYSSSPTVTLRCDPVSGEITKVADSEASVAVADGFRGGSQGVRVDDGYLFVIHETERERRALRYLHRFLLLDDDLCLSAVSTRFTFTADRVEFCAGMALHGEDLVLSFGVSDAAAGLAAVALEEVLALLGESGLIEKDASSGAVSSAG